MASLVTTAKTQFGALYRYLRLRGLVAGLFALVAFLLVMAGAVNGISASTAPWPQRLINADLVQALTLLSAAFAIWTAVSRANSDKILGEYTLSIALAHGYLHNFLMWIPEELGDDPARRLIIFRANKLSDLSDAGKDRVRAKITALGWSWAPVKIGAIKAGGKSFNALGPPAGSPGPALAFDFPMTIRTVESLVEYRSEQDDLSRSDKWPQHRRDAFAREYIERFYTTLAEEIERLGLAGLVVFADAEDIQALTSAGDLRALPTLAGR